MSEAITKRKPKCTGITTMEGISKHVVGIGAGAYVFREDVKAMREMFERHEKERKLFNKTEKDLKTDARFAKAWKKAEKKCFKSFDEANKGDEING